MKPIKINGIEELAKLEKRVTAARGLNRIHHTDFAYIIEHINLIRARIVEMPETDENGEEV